MLSYQIGEAVTTGALAEEVRTFSLACELALHTGNATPMKFSPN